MISEETIRSLEYFFPRQLPTGEWIAVRPMLYTAGLFVGIDFVGYRTRFCYETLSEAVIALLTWDGAGDPPGYWIKEHPADRLNPKWLAEAADELRPAENNELYSVSDLADCFGKPSELP